MIFDEIEYISFIAGLDSHWKTEFISFWQSIWSLQSQYKNISTIVVGVNPTVIEKDLVENIQNPMFGIFRPTYLRGFSRDELSRMLSFFGKRMGIKFQHDAVDYLLKRYGGHPLLTRLACGFIHDYLTNNKLPRPFEVKSEFLIENEDEREQDLVYYCSHIISELRQFYKDEYQLIEFLSEDAVSNFLEADKDKKYTRHLINYGLLEYKDGVKPLITIPILKEFIARELALKNNRSTLKYVIERELRDNYLKKMYKNIINDMRILEKCIKDNNRIEIYGDGSIFEPEKFISIPEVHNESDFNSFINITNKCFVEPIENFGITKKNKNYFWNDFKNNYEYLWDALNRIKVYRNYSDHAMLNESMQNYLDHYLKNDLGSTNIDHIEDSWFILQQRCLDDLFLSIQYEIDKIS